MSNKLDNDDPLHKAMFVVYENVVTSLKENFLMYSDFVFDKMIMAANRKIELTVIEEGDTSGKNTLDPLKIKKHNYAAYKFDMKVDGVKNIVLNTDHLAQKIEATNLMVQMAEDMGTAYSKYIEQTIPVVKELINYKHNKSIRSNMIETVKYMLLDCQSNDQKTLLLNYLYASLCDELAFVLRQKDHGEVSSIIEVMSEAMPYMNQEMAEKLPNMLMAALNLVAS